MSASADGANPPCQQPDQSPQTRVSPSDARLRILVGILRRDREHLRAHVDELRVELELCRQLLRTLIPDEQIDLTLKQTETHG